MWMKYKLEPKDIKCICQQCKSEVKFREQCFLCGEINWSDEVLDRFNDKRNVEGEVQSFTVSCWTRPNPPEDNRVTFGVYPPSFRFM